VREKERREKGLLFKPSFLTSSSLLPFGIAFPKLRMRNRGVFFRIDTHLSSKVTLSGAGAGAEAPDVRLGSGRKKEEKMGGV
jgi:hypothetical protein